MIKTFNFGKVDGYDNGRKTCAVELEAGFREFQGQEDYFTVCADLWNNLHTDIIQGGQCVEELYNSFKSLRNNGKYTLLLSMWKKHHLKKISNIPPVDVAIIKEILSA